MRIGIISDTHGLLRPQAIEALAGVERIIHAGDLGSRSVLDALARIAPVIAVKGNVDTDPWAADIPQTTEALLGGARIYVIHSAAWLHIDPAKEAIHVVVSGHTHRASERVRDGVLYLNPGSAGPRRFRLPVTLMRAVVDDEGLKPELVTLLP